jgi:hypothetical protein
MWGDSPARLFNKDLTKGTGPFTFLMESVKQISFEFFIDLYYILLTFTPNIYDSVW